MKLLFCFAAAAYTCACTDSAAATSAAPTAVVSDDARQEPLPKERPAAKEPQHLRGDAPLPEYLDYAISDVCVDGRGAAAPEWGYQSRPDPPKQRKTPQIERHACLLNKLFVTEPPPKNKFFF